MDQKDFKRIEELCTQEQPPPCAAACPLHVDARALSGHVALGQWNQALGVLRKTMPFPGLLGRVCDGPCMEKCNRSALGGSVRVNDLERTVVSKAGEPLVPPVPPKKPAHVAVFGDGLAGLTAALDLARKGYPVTLFASGETLGLALAGRFPDRLNPDIVARELSVLTRLGVDVRFSGLARAAEYAHEPVGSFQAVFLDLSVMDPALWNLARTGTGGFQADPRLGTTSREGIFAGGDHSSPVFQASQGRFGAATLDRWLQKVSLTAGREKDGPIPTRLFTPLDGIEPEAGRPPADPGQGYADDEAVREAGRCLMCECRACVRICPYLERFGSYPRKYLREIYNNESMVMGVRQANTLIDSCSLCGLCQEICPEGFPMPQVCLEARQRMVRRGKMPPSAHEFALDDMAFSQSERFFMARHEPGALESAWALYPGCQLAASAGNQVDRLYAHLRGSLTGGVGLMLGCCGAPARWAGREDLFANARDALRTEWDRLGRPRMIAACSTCYRIFRDFLPEMTTVSLWWVLDEQAPAEIRLRPNPSALHDPCTTRHEEGIQEAVRRILARSGIVVDELNLSRNRTECCGFGGLMENANPDLAKETIRRRAGQSPLDYLAYCAMCRDALAGVGKRAAHVLDLFFPPENVPDPALRPRPGWTDRQENRSRLKERLLGTLWGDDRTREPAAHEAIRLILSLDVENRMEQRRILKSDIQKVVLQAQATGRRLRHKTTGHYLASFRPTRVTFWVEYTPRPDGFEIHDAYSHRMDVAEGGQP